MYLKKREDNLIDVGAPNYNPSIAPLESKNTSSHDYSEGMFLNLKGIFKKAISNIAVGDSFIDNTNIEDTTVGDELYTLTQKIAIIGEMKIFAGSTVPTGYLLCDGQAVSRETYSDLFDVIGTTWGAGDGSTTFNVPDMREVAPVGVGTSSRTESTHESYTLGEFKDDQFQSHTHSYTAAYASSQQEKVGSYPDGNAVGAYFTFGTNAPNSGRTGSVTRGKRIGVNYIIKY